MPCWSETPPREADSGLAPRIFFIFPPFQGMGGGKGQGLSGTESAILNRESSDSESCDSNRAIPRSL